MHLVCQIRRLFPVPVLVVVSLVLAGVASAGDERIQLSAAGQAAARAAVIKRADLGDASGWTGRAAKPDLSERLECPNYRPKQSDLVVIGAAESTWKNTALQFHSVAQVLQTAAMVRLDWQRSVLVPQAIPCVRNALVKELGASARLVSFRRIAFPQVADTSRAYRALADVKTSAGPVRILYDIVLVAPWPHRDHADGGRTGGDRLDRLRRRGPACTHPRLPRRARQRGGLRHPVVAQASRRAFCGEELPSDGGSGHS